MKRITCTLVGAASAFLVGCGSSVLTDGSDGGPAGAQTGTCGLVSDWRIEQTEQSFDAVTGHDDGWWVLGGGDFGQAPTTWSASSRGDWTSAEATVDGRWARWHVDRDRMVLAAIDFETMHVRSYTADGALAWEAELAVEEGDGITKIMRTGNTTVIVGGRRSSPSSTMDIFTYTLDAEGGPGWSSVVGTSQDERPMAAFIDARGDIVVVAKRWLDGGSGPLWMYATSATGAPRWDFVDEVHSARGATVTVLPEPDGLLVATTLDGATQAGAGARVLRLGDSGELRWTTSLDEGAGRQQVVDDVRPSVDGGYLLAGYDSETASSRVWRLDPSGALRWARSPIPDGLSNVHLRALGPDYLLAGRYGLPDPTGETWSFALIDAGAELLDHHEVEFLGMTTSAVRGVGVRDDETALAVGRWSRDDETGGTAIQWRRDCSAR